MTAPSFSYPSSAPSSPVLGRGERPLVVKTDGESLIFKNVVFPNGKRYDIRIWRKDEEGDLIPIDEKQDLFSFLALSRIHELAKQVFFSPADRGHEGEDRTGLRFTYSPPPSEECKYFFGEDEEGKPLNRPDIVDPIRGIYQELYPPFGRMEIAVGDKDQSLVRLGREKPRPVKQKDVEMPKPTSAPPSPRRSEETASQAPSTESASPLPSPRGAPEEVAPPVFSTTLDKTLDTKINTKLFQVLDAEAKKFSAAHAGSFLANVTYSDLYRHSVKPSINPLLPSVHEAFREVVQGSRSGVSEENFRLMDQWIRTLYLAAYRHFEAELAPRSGESEKQRQNRCKHVAANIVVGFVKISGVNVVPYVKSLEQRPSIN